MTNFVVALWESIFQPGTSPQLIIATHISFALLLCVLGSQIYLTNNIHFIALTIIATLLWITVTWFIYELQNTKLVTNEDLQTVESKKTDKAESSRPNEEKNIEGVEMPDSKPSSTPRKRKTKSRRA